MITRKFQAFVKIIGWWCFSLGVHVDLRGPHIEVHFPFGFARLGWMYTDTAEVGATKWETGLYGWG